MTRLKKAFAWLFDNFSSTLMIWALSAIVVQDFLHTDDPDGWDYGIAIFLCLASILFLVADIVGYRKKMRKLDEDLDMEED